MERSAPIRILVADDHSLLRVALMQMLDATPGCRVVRGVSSGDELVTCVIDRREAVDVVLLDLSMPGLPSMDALERIKRERPEVGVLVLSMHPESKFAVRAIRSGASGYLMKTCTPDELISAIRKVADGGKFISATLAEHLAESVNQTSGKLPHESLTNRELQIMTMLARGKTPTEIAHSLSLSIKTVSTYKYRVFEKLGLDNMADVIRYSIDHALIE
jgi:DNA-binding NarL/FixJ family response regulator